MIKKVCLLVYWSAMPLGAMQLDDLDQPALLESMTEAAAFAFVDSEEAKFVRQFHRDYFQFLVHISGQVDTIEQELANVAYQNIQSDSSWVSYAASCATAAWAVTKKVAHDARSLAINPASKEMAQKLSDKILIIKNLCQTNECLWVTPQDGTQQLLVNVQGKMSRLQAAYHESTSSTVQTQLSYLTEYNNRINRLEKEFQELLKDKW